MYGTVLDQKVFEHLVSRYLPTLSEHFATADIQLSIASLPWFLSCCTLLLISLFDSPDFDSPNADISAMPMIFAFRYTPSLSTALGDADLSIIQDYRQSLSERTE